MLEKPAKHQNPHKTKTLKNIKQNMKKHGKRKIKKKRNQINDEGIKGKNIKNAKNTTRSLKNQPSRIYQHFVLVLVFCHAKMPVFMSA